MLNIINNNFFTLRNMTKNKLSFNLKGFNNIDQSIYADHLVATMDAHYHIDSMKAIKERSLALLNLTQGDYVLDIGCGLGFDTEAIAEMVGQNGFSIGIDNSKRVLIEAQERSKYKNAFYCMGDAINLCFPDNFFSVCRADKLLVSQTNIPQVLSEMIRVVKSGGKISVTCLDFGTITLYPGSVRQVKTIIEYWQQLVENPFIGRQLLPLFTSHGLGNLTLQPEIFYIRKFSTLQKIISFEKILSDMKKEKKLSEVETINLLKELKEADNENTFYWSINLTTIVGVKS
ncbi:hypothetical protein BH10PSE19_BH10PSE19_09520 [soil metagenome]